MRFLFVLSKYTAEAFRHCSTTDRGESETDEADVACIQQIYKDLGSSITGGHQAARPRAGEV